MSNLSDSQGEKPECFETDHTPIWAGDGYFCAKCMTKFVFAPAANPEPEFNDEQAKFFNLGYKAALAKPEKCPTCKGTGECPKHPDELCPKCDGTGRDKDQPGHPTVSKPNPPTFGNVSGEQSEKPEKSKHHKSVFTNERNLLKALIELHSPWGIECDPMYFKGNFYKDGIEQPGWCYDINPDVTDYNGKNRPMLGDARHIPLVDESLNSIMLDPPFMFGIHGKTKQFYSSRTHGIMSWEELSQLYKDILDEAYRVLTKKGVLFFKCQDYTDAKTTMTHALVYNWATERGFYAKDLAILVMPNKVYNGNTKQRHLRKIHTYFWVFVKPGGKAAAQALSSADSSGINKDTKPLDPEIRKMVNENFDELLWKDKPSEPDSGVEELVNTFIKKWVPQHAAHLVDTDDNDGEKLRQAIQTLITQAYDRGKVEGGIAEIERYCTALQEAADNTPPNLLLNWAVDYAWDRKEQLNGDNQ